MVDTVKCPTWQFGVKMNLKQARAKLESISGSTATQHPKVLVGELCIVVKFLLDELDRIKSPVFTKLTSYPDRPDVMRDPLPRSRTSPWVDPAFKPDKKDRKLNAGDTE